MFFVIVLLVSVEINGPPTPKNLSGLGPGILHLHGYMSFICPDDDACDSLTGGVLFDRAFRPNSKETVTSILLGIEASTLLVLQCSTLGAGMA